MGKTAIIQTYLGEAFYKLNRHLIMFDMNTLADNRGALARLGYHETIIQDIVDELISLFQELDFDKIRASVNSALEAKDTAGLISELRDMMVRLETKGYYRPDIPPKLLKLLVNGLNLKKEDIFEVLEQAEISDEKKKEEQEFLASCAAMTQLGYILMSNLVSEVKAANAGSHVFLIIDGFSPDNKIFVDFSLDSIREINVQQVYTERDNYFQLKDLMGIPLDEEISRLLTQYYVFFQSTAGIGLSHNIHNNLGIAYDTAGRYKEAEEEILEALRLYPGYIEAHNNLAVMYEKTGRYIEAIQELQEAIKLSPEYSETHSNLGIIFTVVERYDDAVAQLQEAIRLNPEYAPAYNGLGNIYARQNRNDEAINEFQEAIRLDPDFALAHNNLGCMYCKLDRNEEAVNEFEETIELDSRFVEAYYGLGLAYYNLDRFDRAAHALVKAVYFKPELMDSVPDKIKLKVTQGISRLRFSE